MYFHILTRLTICIIIFSFLFTPALVLAEDTPSLGNAKEYLKKTGGKEGAGYAIKDIDPFLGNIIYEVFAFVGVIFLILMIYGGYLWMTARGNDEQLTKAKKIIQAAIVGIIIVAGAGAISWFVISVLTE